MEKELYIVCSDSEREQIEGLLKESLAEKGYMLRTGAVTSDPDSWDTAINAERVGLWLTPNAEDAVYQISSRRLESGKHTVNIFPEMMFISADRKKSVGMNQSVFASLHPTGIAPDLCSVLPSEQSSTSTVSNSQSKSTPVTATESISNEEGKKKSIPWKTILWGVGALLLFGILFG